METTDGNEQTTLRETIEQSIATVTDAPDTAAPQESDAQRIDRERDEKGRFSAKEEKTVSAQPTKPDAKARTVSASPVPAAVAESEIQPIPRPSSWKKEMWPVWDKMAAGTALDAKEARQVAEYNATREQQFASGVSTYKQEAERAKPVMDALAPFYDDIKREGVEAPQAVHALLMAHRNLKNGAPAQKMQMLAKLAQDYNIPLRAFFDQNVQQQYLNSATQQQQPQQPNFEAMIESTLVRREAEQTVAQMEKDTQKYPYLQYVRATMAQYIEAGEATDLDEAYRKALDNPQHAAIAGAMQHSQAQADEQRKAEAAKTAARVARGNAVSPKSATPAAAPANTKKGVRESLREAMDLHSGSARV